MTNPRIWLIGIATATAIGVLTGSPSTAGRSAPTAIPSLYQHPGKILAGNCFQCHGTDGKNGAFGSLAGKSASEIYTELKEFQTSTSTGDALMKIHALGYTDAQLRLIADYFANVR